TDNRLQRVAVDTVDPLAEDLTQLAFARGDRCRRLGTICNQVDLDLPAAGQNGERLMVVRLVVRLEPLLDARLGEAGDLQHASLTGTSADTLLQPRHEVRLQHRFELV